MKYAPPRNVSASKAAGIFLCPFNRIVFRRRREGKRRRERAGPLSQTVTSLSHPPARSRSGALRRVGIKLAARRRRSKEIREGQLRFGGMHGSEIENCGGGASGRRRRGERRRFADQ